MEIENLVSLLPTWKISAIFTGISIIGLLGAIPLAIAQQSGYNLTVYVTSHPFGNAYSYVSITTENGYKDTKFAYSDQGSVATFYIPPNEGSTVEVCISYYLLGVDNCQSYGVTGSDITVNQDGPSS
jgi:hypothetical protein